MFETIIGTLAAIALALNVLYFKFDLIEWVPWMWKAWAASGALTVIFVGLELTNIISWGLVWALSPLWIMLFALTALFTAFLLFVRAIFGQL